MLFCSSVCVMVDLNDLVFFVMRMVVFDMFCVIVSFLWLFVVNGCCVEGFVSCSC